MAAKTGNRLKNTIKKEHSLDFHTVYMGSDSKITIVETEHLYTVWKWSENSFIIEYFRQLFFKNVLWTRRTSLRASVIACNNFYKDDLLVSLQSKPEAAEIEVELSTLLAKVGCELIKWATNCADDKALTILGLEKKIGAIHWKRLEDYSLSRKINGPNLKSYHLNQVSSIHWDSCCFLSFVEVILKKMETKRQQWHSFIEDILNDQFSYWVGEINADDAFEVERWYNTSNWSFRNELYIFRYSSQYAFCAVAYVVTENSSRDCKVFHCGQSRSRTTITS